LLRPHVPTRCPCVQPSSGKAHSSRRRTMEEERSRELVQLQTLFTHQLFS
ncbi:Hypothetical protein SMAX5B_021181, partial [Scophthalmus maximus]